MGAPSTPDIDGHTAWKAVEDVSQTLPSTLVINLRQHLKVAPLDSIQSVLFLISEVRENQ